jgi:hypothetical protein
MRHFTSHEAKRDAVALIRAGMAGDRAAQRALMQANSADLWPLVTALCEIAYLAVSETRDDPAEWFTAVAFTLAEPLGARREDDDELPGW